MAADVGVSANDDSHYLPPPLGGGGSYRCVSLLRVWASYPPRRTSYSQSEFRSRLRALPAAQPAIRGTYYRTHSCIHSYSSCRFSHVLSICQDPPGRHSFHSCTTSTSFFVVFSRWWRILFFINFSHALTPKCIGLSVSWFQTGAKALVYSIMRMIWGGMSLHYNHHFHKFFKTKNEIK